MILWSFERGPNRLLLGMVSAKARPQQPVNAFGIRLDSRRVARNDSPTNAPSRHEIIFRHAAEGDEGYIGRDRGEGDVGRVFRLLIIKDQFVVDLVGKDHKVVT